MYEREIFIAALDKPVSERPAFIADICAGNSALRSRVEALLAEEDQLAGFMETPAISGPLPAGEKNARRLWRRRAMSG